MSSDNSSTLGLDEIDLDNHPDGSLDVIGAVRQLTTAGGNSHATRGEIERLLNAEARDYQWIRYRCDSLFEAGVLTITHVDAGDRVEKRYEIADDYVDDARKIARTLSLTDGEIPTEVGVDEFVDLAGALGDAIDRIDELESQMPRQDLDERLDRLNQRVSEFERYIQNN